MTENKEIRSFEVRAIEDTKSQDMLVEGYAATFDSRSELLGNFYETIAPGAFSDVLSNDVYANFNHDMSVVFARTKNGSLQLEQDDKGLKVRFKLPNTQAARDIYTLLREGVLDKMSFAFSVKTDSWKKVDGTPFRTIEKVGRLYDVSIVSIPAYSETSVSARDMANAIVETPEVNEVSLQAQVNDTEGDEAKQRALLAAFRSRERQRYSI